MALLLPLLFASLASSSMITPPCRFSPGYSQREILQNSSAFAWDVFHWEGQFHQDGVGYNSLNGMTYDGTLLDLLTGFKRPGGGHTGSAASKEALQLMVYAHVIAGNPQAVQFINSHHPGNATEWVVAILSTKLQTYIAFNKTFPGFGGFLPWFIANEPSISPTPDFVDRVPALDNGELLWAVYAVVQVLHQSKDLEIQQLGDSWEQWLNYTKLTASRIFYRGNGAVCAAATLQQSIPPFSPEQNYSCHGGFLVDPYEGELFTWWLYFFGDLSAADKEAVWTAKRARLVAVNYTGPVVDSTASSRIDPITVQKGFWFSSHEAWKLLEMPYLDVPIVKRVFHNGERARTCNSVLMGGTGGMFASVNNITDPSTGHINGYISNAGIPSIAQMREQELDVITPYSVFPTILFNHSVGLAWYKNMLDAKGMQNPYGSTESLRRDGTGISALVTWDSKITTVVALLGGVSEFVRAKMHGDGIYDAFIQVISHQYDSVFGNNSAGRLFGEHIELCLPNFDIPVAGVTDFTGCPAPQ